LRGGRRARLKAKDPNASKRTPFHGRKEDLRRRNENYTSKSRETQPKHGGIL